MVISNKEDSCDPASAGWRAMTLMGNLSAHCGAGECLLRLQAREEAGREARCRLVGEKSGDEVGAVRRAMGRALFIQPRKG